MIGSEPMTGDAAVNLFNLVGSLWGLSIGMIAPTILAHGTDAAKERAKEIGGAEADFRRKGTQSRCAQSVPAWLRSQRPQSCSLVSCQNGNRRSSS